MNFPETINKFPITQHLDNICSSLKNSKNHVLILTAETAAGKSTVLPLALLQAFNGNIIMTEPRRLATLGVANRVASLLEEECGNTVGYRIHLENKISSQTRFEIITEGILVRMLQQDPALENYNVVVLDEFHERTINTDLALAFLKEAMELRDDLYVIIMSATIQTKRLSDFMNNAQIMQIPGKMYPVDVVYQPETNIENAIISEIFSLKNSKFQQNSNKNVQNSGNLLVFLPGISEISKVQKQLTSQLSDNSDWEICILHSSISLSEQKKILSPSDKHRIILSSAIAETSLTVPGITCVIDSGFSRINRLNVNTGMENLVTEKVCEFSAEQRKGRAGREQSGKCIRLWNQFDVLQKEVQPEILRTDLIQLVLECAERGIYNLSNIQLLDTPTQNAWNSASSLLKNLDCINEENHITEKGKLVLQTGISPRLGCLAIESCDSNGIISSKAKEFLLKFCQYSQNSLNIQNQFLANLQNKIQKNLVNLNKFQKNSSNFAEFSSKNFQNSSILILSGFPDRLAVRVSEQGIFPTEYQFPSGRKAILHSSLKSNSKFIAAPEVMAGQSEGIIFNLEELPEAQTYDWLQSKKQQKTDCHFENGKIIKSKIECYGQIILSSKNMQASPEDYSLAWINEISQKGLDVLPSDSKTESFLERVYFYNQQTNEYSQKLEKLQFTVQQWLSPFITGKLTPEVVYQALYWYLDGSIIDEQVPLQITLPNGNRTKIKYEKLASPSDKTKLVLRPVIEIIIQRAFGCTTTPKICGMKVLFRLLSPAQRPLQITDDLENFWTSTWPEICKEMKGRYPKHNWDPSKPLKD